MILLLIGQLPSRLRLIYNVLLANIFFRERKGGPSSQRRAALLLLLQTCQADVGLVSFYHKTQNINKLSSLNLNIEMKKLRQFSVWPNKQ